MPYWFIFKILDKFNSRRHKKHTMGTCLSRKVRILGEVYLGENASTSIVTNATLFYFKG
jgi:hypothetical protein